MRTGFDDASVSLQVFVVWGYLTFWPSVMSFVVVTVVGLTGFTVWKNGCVVISYGFSVWYLGFELECLKVVGQVLCIFCGLAPDTVMQVLCIFALVVGIMPFYPMFFSCYILVSLFDSLWAGWPICTFPII